MRYIFLLFLLIAFTSHGQVNQKTITVNGIAKMKVKPDIAVLHLIVEKSDTVETVAMKLLNNEVDELSHLLERQGLDKKQIKIAEYSVSTNYVPYGQKKEYRAFNSLNVKLPTNEALANQLLASIESGKFSGLQIRFEYIISDSLDKVSRSILIQKAMADAKANAESIAKSLKVQLKEVKQVSRITFAGLLGNNSMAYEMPSVMQEVVVTSVTPFSKYEVEDRELSEQVNVVYVIN